MGEATYEQLLAHSPKIADYYPEEYWNWTKKTNEQTGSHLLENWKENLRLNATKIFPHCGTVKDTCEGFGFNKAAIMIGAGPSLNKNLKLLRQVCLYNSTFPFEQQPFLFFCCNHEYKRMVSLGIIPHFVVLLDSADTLYDQLCKDVPKAGRGSVLLVPPRISHKMLSAWKNQGKEILFYLGDNPCLVEEFEKVTGRKVRGTGEVVVFGGNVLNMMYLLATAYMNCSVFMALGNDLCYDYDPDLNKRRATYYADKDYSTNLASGRDEANKSVPWFGYKLEESAIVPGNFNVRFIPKATTAQLFLYKTWMEVRIGIQEAHNRAFHYYNCSEGVLGVLCRDRTKEGFMKPENWYLLDEIYPKRWHTRTFAQAVDEFLMARKELCRRFIEEIPIGAGLVAV